MIGTATALQGSDIPADFPERDRLFKPEEWINDGDAVVIKPTGAIAAGPLNREKGHPVCRHRCRSGPARATVA